MNVLKDLVIKNLISSWENAISLELRQ